MTRSKVEADFQARGIGYDRRIPQDRAIVDHQDISTMVGSKKILGMEITMDDAHGESNRRKGLEMRLELINIRNCRARAQARLLV